MFYVLTKLQENVQRGHLEGWWEGESYNPQVIQTQFSG